MKLLVRAAALTFSLAGLTLAVVHGCSKPGPAPAAAPPVQNAAAAPSPSSDPPAVEEDPAYLGATKAAVMVHPKPAGSTKKQK